MDAALRLRFTVVALPEVTATPVWLFGSYPVALAVRV
jgi:hypothetical protein